MLQIYNMVASVIIAYIIINIIVYIGLYIFVNIVTYRNSKTDWQKKIAKAVKQIKIREDFENGK